MITRRSFFQFAVLAVAAGTAGLAVTLAPVEAEARERVRDHRRRCRVVRLSDHHGGPICR